MNKTRIGKINGRCPNLRKSIYNSKLQFTLTFLIPVLVIFFTFNVLANAVPVIPNESVLKGTVMEYCLTSSSFSGISPEQVLYKLVVFVEAVEDVRGYPNFLKGKEGQSVTFYSKEKQTSELLGKKIKALVEYKGDERGGLFWIKHIEIIK